MVGFKVPYSVLIEGMANYQNASKRPRLDNWDDDLGNDDFWDQGGEITAEEFDMVEVQASQALQNTTSLQTNGTMYNASANTAIILQNNADNMKLKQFELEGKIKILNELLNKALNDLSKERIDREGFINQRLNDSKSKEEELQKEIDKLKTTLQFQEQEIKSMHNKSQALEQRLKQARNSTDIPCSPSQKKSAKFPSKFEFEKGATKTVSAGVQTNISSNFQNQYKLALMSEKGKLEASSVVSQLLLNRSKMSLKQSLPHQQLKNNQQHSSSWFMSSLTNLAKLNFGQITEESWKSYDDFLKRHATYLQNLSTNLPLTGFKNITLGLGHLSAQSQENEAEQQHIGTLNCLKDIAEVLHCQSENSALRKINFQKNQIGNEMVGESSSESGSNPLFVMDENKMDVKENYPLCLLSLITLANPAIYPSMYNAYKASEVENALNSLVIWSAHIPTSLAFCLDELPIHQLVSGQCSAKSSHLTLQLMSNLIHVTTFKKLVHQRDLCLVTDISELCHLVGANLNENAQTVNVIENFLSAAISRCKILVVGDEECQCLTKIVQEFIVLLWRQCHTYLETSLPIHRNSLSKGVELLHHMSNRIESFQEKRGLVEDQYISLICMLSRLAKQKLEFKPLRDYIQELWDFQDDSSEFSGEDHNNDTNQESQHS